jgi:hypothetical protein
MLKEREIEMPSRKSKTEEEIARVLAELKAPDQPAAPLLPEGFEKGSTPEEGIELLKQYAATGTKPKIFDGKAYTEIKNVIGLNIDPADIKIIPLPRSADDRDYLTIDKEKAGEYLFAPGISRTISMDIEYSEVDHDSKRYCSCPFCQAGYPLAGDQFVTRLLKEISRQEFIHQITWQYAPI